MTISSLNRIDEAMRANRRLTVQMQVKEVGTAESARLASLLPQGWNEGAHLTVLHLGRLGVLYREIGAASRQTVTRDRFLHELSSYHHSFSKSFATEESVTISKFELLLRGAERYAVLAVEPSPRLKEIRNCCRNLFLSAISKLGISQPENFMATSEAVDQISPTWFPHITIPTEPPSEYRDDFITDGLSCILRPPDFRL